MSSDTASTLGDTVGAVLYVVIGLGLGVGVLLFLAMVVYRSVAKPDERKERESTARDRFVLISSQYSSVALRLDQIDVRANSLTSPIADDELRRQWEQCKEAFLRADEIIDRTGLTLESRPRAFGRHADDVAAAYRAVERMSTAEDSIDVLFSMEQGDGTVRHDVLTDLIGDINEAQSGAAGDPRLLEQLDTVEAQFRSLRDERGDEGFMDRFAAVLSRYGRVTAEGSSRPPPRIYETDYRIGAGYGGFTPYRTAPR
ncbi:MAG: hypothetical protein ACTIL2_12280 [Corynebacterium sp.]|uniref:hypothetical protein n=1 Tax=Corynebacterium sp. TaxID=1720 RepID=UPI003F9A385C